ncbi:MAG: hypothetical protein JW751_30665 [Polyangiaceae bacterium]|nr:hypothetical protein [Polyangiaceae bacterium]
MPAPPWDPGDHARHYHLNSFSGTFPIPTVVPRGQPAGRESKTFRSLESDLNDLRAEGARLGIVDPGETTIGRGSFLSTPIWALKMGTGTQGRVLITGGIHAREWITVELTYLLALYLVQNYRSAPSTPEERRIHHLLHHREIWFVPLINPEGHHFSVFSDRTWRMNLNLHDLPAMDREFPTYDPSTYEAHPTNRRRIQYPAGLYLGVDLNRSFPTHVWICDTKASTHNAQRGTASDTFKGIDFPREAENEALMSLISDHGPFTASLSFHSFGHVLLYTRWGGNHDNNAAPVPRNDHYHYVGQGMKDLYDQRRTYVYTSPYRWYSNPAEPGEAACTGDFLEYHWERTPGCFGFAPEVSPQSPAPPGWEFSGLPESQILPCFVDNLAPALALICCAGYFNQPPGARQTTQPTTNANWAVRLRVMPSCWRVFRDWTAGWP